ncbi:MAG TPA: glycosyltransferase [Steroidobacteraceae bacterium]
MPKPAIAMFCMPEDGHFKPLRPLISGLAESGFAVHVFTHRRYGTDVRRAGGILVDLFARYPLDRADSESIPIPCRYVSFAAAYAEEVLEELKRLRTVLVVYETFAVIARLAARLLGVPYVNVSPCHNLDPARYLPMLRADPRVAISEGCQRAVETLRERYGVGDASPFDYLTGLSPYLNICCEPPEFLTQEERKVFEPVGFYGSLLSPADSSKRSTRVNDDPERARIYVCFGTVAPKYYADAALGVFRAVSECLEAMPQAHALISLGGAAFEAGMLRRLARPNVEVADYVDQWRVLGEVDLFVTHHGNNSTHEAIVRRVPMLSYPFFSDQPALAERCRQFGIAIPLVRSTRETVTAQQFRAVINQGMASRESLRASLDRARVWELDVMAGRGAVLRRIRDLIV